MRKIVRIALFACAAASAQTDSPIAFEAASIKPFPAGSNIVFSGCMGGPGSDNPGRIDCQHVTLKMLLMRAYQVKSQEVIGPGWLESEHFNILAKMPQGATKDQVPAMFRVLLAERFHVVLHREKRMLPTYVLTLAKGGLKIKEWTDKPPAADEPPPGAKLRVGEDGFPILRQSTLAGGAITLFRQGRARMQGQTTMPQLAESLSGQLNQVVVDETGLTAKYEVVLNWTPDPTDMGGGPRAAAGSTDATAPPDLFVAIEQQLGLKLVAKKVERDAIVVDSADKAPTGN